MKGDLHALLWLIAVGTRNQLRRRLARLKDPRYSIALAVGLLYFPWIFSPWVRDSRDTVLPPALVSLAPLAPLLIVALVIVAWIRGGRQSALALTPAETSLLVPAPLTRRQLIRYKLLGSQLGILLSVLILSVFISPAALPWYLVIPSLWIVVTTLQLHQIAASLVQAGATEHGAAGLRRFAVPVILAALAFTAIAWSALDALPVARSGDLAGALATLGESMREPLPRIALFPVTALLAPLLAAGHAEWLAAVPPALGVLVLHYVWLMRADHAFEEAAAEAGRLRAEQQAAIRSGRWLARWPASGRRRTRRPPAWRRRLALGAAGRPVVAVLWKNALLFFMQVRPTLILALLGLLVGVFLVLWAASGPRVATAFLLTFSTVLFVVISLLGPLGVRADLRRDLESLELLKTFPIDGRRLVAAEIAAPALALAACQAPLVGLWLVAVPMAPANALPVAAALCFAAAALIVLVPVNATLIAIQNAIALLWPAWTHIGAHQPGGVEHMGRMLLTMLATFLGAALASMLPLAAGTLVWALLQGLGPPALVGGALGAALVMTLQLRGLFSRLGTFYDDMDPADAGLLR